MSFKAQWYRDKFAKKRQKGYCGYPIASVAFYGPDDKRASKVSVGIIAREGADVDPLERWFSETADVRNDPAIIEAVVRFIEQYGAKTIASHDRVIGCPHEEGIDYPEGQECPQCPYWAKRDRWTGKVERPVGADQTDASPIAETGPVVRVALDELLDAFEWVSAGESVLGSQAFVSRVTGEVYWAGDGVEQELPDDIDDGSLYIAVPGKSRLELGRSLALRFAEDFLPDSYDTIQDYFRKRGAYARFKSLLERAGKLEAWHQYEQSAVESALRKWCEANDLVLGDQGKSGA